MADVVGEEAVEEVMTDLMCEMTEVEALLAKSFVRPFYAKGTKLCSNDGGTKLWVVADCNRNDSTDYLDELHAKMLAAAVNLADKLELLVARAKREEAEWWHESYTTHTSCKPPGEPSLLLDCCKRLAALRAEEARLGGNDAMRATQVIDEALTAPPAPRAAPAAFDALVWLKQEFPKAIQEIEQESHSSFKTLLEDYIKVARRAYAAGQAASGAQRTANNSLHQYPLNWCSRHGVNFKRDEACQMCVKEATPAPAASGAQRDSVTAPQGESNQHSVGEPPVAEDFKGWQRILYEPNGEVSAYITPKGRIFQADIKRTFCDQAVMIEQALIHYKTCNEEATPAPVALSEPAEAASGAQQVTIQRGELIPATINGEPGKVAFFSDEAAAAYGFKLAAPAPRRPR